MKLDAKFYGEIRKVKDDSIVSDEEYVVFLAKDNAFAEVLPLYLEACIRLNCDSAQIEAVKRMIFRVQDWRSRHPENTKNPDAMGERLLDAPPAPVESEKDWMGRELTGIEMDALDYLWGGGDEIIECQKIAWVSVRYPHKCMTIIHKGKQELPTGTLMVRETAKVEGRFGTCYTCSDCIRAAIAELLPPPPDRATSAQTQPKGEK